MEYINYYGVEKYNSFIGDYECYFIPYEYKVGTYKINEIEHLKYNSIDFEKMDESKRRDILSKYMIWFKYPLYISNGDSCISVLDMNLLDITYNSNDNNKNGMLFEIVNSNDKDDFYRYIEKENGDYNKVIDECVEIIYDKLFTKLKEDYSNREICKLFLDFFNSSDAPVINFTVVCKEDIDNVLDKYGYCSYEEYCDEKFKGFDLFRKFISYKKEYEIYTDGILNNSGDYNFDDCVYHLNDDNIPRVVSYFCSLFEYDSMWDYFLFIVCNKVKEKLMKNLKEFKLASDFKFYDVSEWD